MLGLIIQVLFVSFPCAMWDALKSGWKKGGK